MVRDLLRSVDPSSTMNAMTGLTFKLYGGPGMRWLGGTTHYGAAIEQARRLTMGYGVRMEVWATDTGGRGVRVHLVYQCG